MGRILSANPLWAYFNGQKATILRQLIENP